MSKYLFIPALAALLLSGCNTIKKSVPINDLDVKTHEGMGHWMEKKTPRRNEMIRNRFFSAQIKVTLK